MLLTMQMFVNLTSMHSNTRGQSLVSNYDSVVFELQVQITRPPSGATTTP